MAKNKTAILLMNLGSPRSCSVADVREYLSEFLMDPEVLDIPFLNRWLLVHGIILRTRPKKSAHAYQQIWTENGSPLVFHTAQAADQLQQKLGSEFSVRWAMRYGDHKPAEALREWAAKGDIGKIIFFPMYPQYATSSTRTALNIFRKSAQEIIPGVPVVEIQDYFQDAGFIQAWADLLRPALFSGSGPGSSSGATPDLLLLTYHGLPERQITKIPECGSACRFDDCCSNPAAGVLSRCYRAQCYATTRALCKALSWPMEKTFVSFQSRLGRTPWIKPYTDIVLPDLVARGAKRIVVASPSFTADCLETLEEINIRLREQFSACGGDDFAYVPCLNSSPAWISAIESIVRRN